MKSQDERSETKEMRSLRKEILKLRREVSELKKKNNRLENYVQIEEDIEPTSNYSPKPISSIYCQTCKSDNVNEVSAGFYVLLFCIDCGAKHKRKKSELSGFAG